MAEKKDVVKKPFKGAKVDWPADMPDDMLEDAITVAKKALDEHDFEEEGVQVSFFKHSIVLPPTFVPKTPSPFPYKLTNYLNVFRSPQL